MKDELKKSYKDATGQKVFPHGANINSGKRLFKTFQTGNWQYDKERLFFPKPAGGDGMQPMWTLIAPFAEEPDSIPATMDAFDEWIFALIEKMASAYAHEYPRPLGMAQKTVNLFLKDLWAWSKLTDEQECCLHAPVDREVLKNYDRPPQSWIRWTQVKYCNPTELHNLYDDYMMIQKRLRARANELSVPALTVTPIMLEQMLWGGIPHGYEDTVPGGANGLNGI